MWVKHGAKIFQQEIEIAAGFEANCPGMATERGLGIHEKIKMSHCATLRLATNVTFYPSLKVLT
jgi:hypothetical protein